jgi:hypothetical protein
LPAFIAEIVVERRLRNAGSLADFLYPGCIVARKHSSLIAGMRSVYTPSDGLLCCAHVQGSGALLEVPTTARGHRSCSAAKLVGAMAGIIPPDRRSGRLLTTGRQI